MTACGLPGAIVAAQAPVAAAGGRSGASNGSNIDEDANGGDGGCCRGRHWPRQGHGSPVTRHSEGKKC